MKKCIPLIYYSCRWSQYHSSPYCSTNWWNGAIPHQITTIPPSSSSTITKNSNRETKRKKMTTVLPYEEELNYCIDIAYEAGVIANDFCQKRKTGNEDLSLMMMNIEQKVDETPVTDFDKKLDSYIKEALEKRFPDYLVVGEESATQVSPTRKLEEGKVFLVDPIDGTKDFIKNNGEWCVMIALNVNGVPNMAVVYVASRDHLYYAVKGHGTYIMENNLQNKSLNRSSVSRRLHANSFVDAKDMTCIRSRSHDEPEVGDVMNYLGIYKSFHCGSFGIKAGMIAQGVFDLYVNSSKKTHYWDTAAPSLLVSEAGGVLLDMDGNELKYTGFATNTLNEVVLFATINTMKEKAMEAVKKIYANKR